MSNGSVIPPFQVPGARPPGQGGQAASVQSLPDSLKTVPRPMLLEAEVVGQNTDGSTRVRTAEGMIDLAVRGRQPQPGARLELSVPAGSPPTQVTVRPLAPPPQAPSAPQSQTPQSPSPQSQTPQSPSPQTPPAQPVPRPQTPAPAQPAPAAQQPASVSQPTATQAPPTSATPQAPVTADIPDALNPAASPVAVQPTTAPPPGTAPPKPAAPLASTYQPPSSGAAPIPTMPLQEGQFVRLAFVPPVEAHTAIKAAMTAIEADGETSALTQIGIGKSSIPSQGKGAIALQTPGQKIQPASANALPGAAIGATPGKEPAAVPIITHPMGNTLPLNALPGADIPDITHIALSKIPAAQSNPASGVTPAGITSTPLPATEAPAAPTLFRLDAKIVSILPPEPNVTGLSVAPATNAALPSQPPAPAPQAHIPQILTSLSAAPASLLTATVVGFTPQNLPLVTVRWPGGGLSAPLLLQFPADNLVPGSRLMLQPQTPQLQAGTAAPSRPAWPLLAASPLWPAMEDIAQGLTQAAPQLQTALARILPNPGSPAQMGAATMLFAAALRTGDLTNWLGEKKIEALAKLGKTALLSRLAADTGVAAKNLSEPQAEWKSYPVPMLWQGEIAKVMLHVHHDRQAQEREDKGGGTRFVMDLSLTRMGEVQLDGFVKDKRLDIIVRTELPISTPMQEAMKKAYAEALDGGPVFGEVGFQSDHKGWAKIVKRDDLVTQSA